MSTGKYGSDAFAGILHVTRMSINKRNVLGFLADPGSREVEGRQTEHSCRQLET